MIPHNWIEEAVENTAKHVHETPLTYDSELDLYLKWENQQVTGSFKVRGALNKVICLQAWEQERGLVAASAGNHGAGVALAAKTIGVPATIFVPQNADAAKIKAIKQLGAALRRVEGGYGEAEAGGMQYALDRDKTWVSPYNDGQVISGQATLGLEVLRQLPGGIPCTWLVPVGGGGLLAGILSAYQYAKNQTGVQYDGRDQIFIGVQSEASPFMHAIYSHGSQEGVVEHSSLADGLAGKIEGTSITIPIIKRYANDLVLVSEYDIARAIVYAWQKYQQRIEGSAAAALAAVLFGDSIPRPLLVIISGGNIDPEVHQSLCREFGVK